MCSFSQGEFENFLRHIAAFRSDHQLGADVLLKLLALDQLLRTNKQDEGTLGRSQHTVDPAEGDAVRGYFHPFVAVHLGVVPSLESLGSFFL